ncbi:MAG: hypothetical protein B6I37_08090 [Desulfobacteraceae bacterium 4572_35.2]|nr:MAG: hypothetical protein B6I37_08090 [Desulfobacteraceae bacterium 4572_35.2]
MIARIVLFVLVFFLGYTIFSALMRWLRGQSSTKETKNDLDQMVQCAQCGTYVAQSDAIRKKKHGEVYYLCDETCLEKYKRP